MIVLESLWTLVKLIPLPAVVVCETLATADAPYNKHRTLRRIIGDAAARYMANTFSIPQIRKLSGSTLDVYTNWAVKAKVPLVVDEIGGDAKLLWIGPRRLERVILVVHGGGFMLPPMPAHLLFWDYVRVELEKKGLTPGVVFLNYSLWPEATFPTQLAQLCRAIKYLTAAGVQPSSIQLAGDSAGGNLILQLFSHILHPHPAVDMLVLVEPLRAAYLISPWVGLSGETASHDENDKIDYARKESLIWIGSRIAGDVPEEYRAFAQASKAPEGWFTGVDAVVGDVLVTAGGSECLRDDVLIFGDMMKRVHPKTEVVVQPGGIHVDMFMDFWAGETKVGMLTPLILDRLLAGCA
ncbi:Alpha/Beta hydrolase protein [Roridomyces roridus]|uniref:Alpha/Beta hydrolase protein n=1 Tax=Roridomyces roridus TaxID=1738132 RepID=A0AAD7C9T4_9AGAR|nr:Alpha/Beta hydrolase protein [Roridomyces roridus]